MNRAMMRKISSGECVDLAKAPREGRHYVVERFREDVDYCDSRTGEWIWSVGRRYSDGKVLASLSTSMYQNPEFECLWLR